MTTMPTMKEVLLYLIKCGPGRTEAQLAQAIFDSAGYQQRVNGNCLFLINRGLIERRGGGGKYDPYRYFPVL